MARVVKKGGSQANTRTGEKEAILALTALLGNAKIDASDILQAISTLAEVKEISADHKGGELSIYQEKELVYDDENAFIYRRGDTRRRTYYLRIYDTNSKKPYIKSLNTIDRVRAISQARLIYKEVIGKIERGERLKSPTPEVLIKEYLSEQEKKITTVPREGITPEVFKLKKYHLSNWIEYLKAEDIDEKTIDMVEPKATTNYGYFMLKKLKQDGTRRSIELINNGISEVKRMYKYAAEQQYISRERIPLIERLREQPDEGYKRDIFELEEYEEHWKFLEHVYTKDSRIKEEERLKRIIFAKTWGILMNTGMRPKELLGLKVNEIKMNPHIKDADERKKQVVMRIRADNSKTGRARSVVAPVRRRIDAILNAYKQLGINHLPEDYLLISPTSKTRESYTRQAIYQRLKASLEESGLTAKMAKTGKTISLYSARHTYITWRLRFGGVPIHLLAKQVGTSVMKIEKTYGHIEVEKQAEEITRAQGKAVEMELDFTSILATSSDE